jgi:hypothetical protein
MAAGKTQIVTVAEKAGCVLWPAFRLFLDAGEDSVTDVSYEDGMERTQHQK